MHSHSHSGDKCLPSRAHDTQLDDDDGRLEGDVEDDQSGISDAVGCHDDDSEMQ